MRLQKKAAHNVRFHPVLSRLKKILLTDRIHHFFSALAQPEKPKELQREIDRSLILGLTRDNCQIVLVDPESDSAVLREIGRLRELTFRRVGEGTGRKRDLDSYDHYYRHLVVWDRQNKAVAGAYRLGEGRRILEHSGVEGFYTHSLYHYEPALLPCLEQGLELGRSFVSPSYWGKASLDYLWQGIGAYLAYNPHIRYLFGPVSMSARYPADVTAELVYYFLHYFPAQQEFVRARIPYRLDASLKARFASQYCGLEQKKALEKLQQSFAEQGVKMPVLFKQYAGLYDAGGFQTLQFSVDPAFSDCVDGLCVADLTRLKAKKRKRYIPPLVSSASSSEPLERDHAKDQVSALYPGKGSGSCLRANNSTSGRPVNLVKSRTYP